MAKIEITYLSGPDIEALELTPQEILDAVEGGLAAQGRGRTVIEPRVHLQPDPAFDGHFNPEHCFCLPVPLEILGPWSRELHQLFTSYKCYALQRPSPSSPAQFVRSAREKSPLHCVSMRAS